MTNQMICVICAMEKELISLRDSLEHVSIEKYLNYEFFVGDYHHNKVVICKSGIGKVNAGALTIMMIEHYNPDLIINTGIAGGYNKELKTLDIVVATGLVYSDVDMTTDTSIDVRYGQLQDLPLIYQPSIKIVDKIKSLSMDLKYGTIMTGDQFVVDYQKVDNIVNNYFSDLNVLACDMESAAYAQICYKNKIDFIVLRAISDIIGENNVADYGIYCHQAASKVSDLVRLIISEL